MKFLANIVAAAMLAVITTPALAEYPDRPVNFVTPSAAGASNDIVARVFAQRLQEKWKQPVVVVNRPGGQSMLAEAAVFNAPGDGYTMLWCGAERSFNAAQDPASAGYDLNGFANVTQLGKQPFALVARSDLPQKTIQEFIAYAKANPGKINTGNNSPTGSMAVTFNRLMKDTGTDFTGIAYGSAGEMLTALVKKEVDVALATLSITEPFIANGSMRILAIADDVRTEKYPDVPTIQEALKLSKPIILRHWFGVFLPAKTPQAIVDKINADIVEVLSLPEVRDPLTKQGLTIVANKQADFNKVMADEVESWKLVLAGPAK